MTSHEVKMPEMPEAALLTHRGTEGWNADQMQAYGRACYLAGLEAARQAVPAQSAFGNKVWDDKWLSGMMDCRATTLSNLTALVKEAQK